MSEEKRVIIFDTETTNLPDYKKPSDDPCQPHLVELAAKLYKEDGTFVDSMSCLIKPDGWVISDEVIAIHGITNEFAAEHGIAEEQAVMMFMSFYERASKRVAHNRSFDDLIMRIAIKRYIGDDAAELYKALPAECTAQLSKPICQLPPTEKMKATNFRNSFKTPTLPEALLHFTGRVLEGGHRAEVDVTACADVYFAIKGVVMPVEAEKPALDWWEMADE